MALSAALLLVGVFGSAAGQKFKLVASNGVDDPCSQFQGYTQVVGDAADDCMAAADALGITDKDFNLMESDLNVKCFVADGRVHYNYNIKDSAVAPDFNYALLCKADDQATAQETQLRLFDVNTQMAMSIDAKDPCSKFPGYKQAGDTEGHCQAAATREGIAQFEVLSTNNDIPLKCFILNNTAHYNTAYQAPQFSSIVGEYYILCALEDFEPPSTTPTAAATAAPTAAATSAPAEPTAGDSGTGTQVAPGAGTAVTPAVGTAVAPGAGGSAVTPGTGGTALSPPAGGTAVIPGAAGTAVAPGTGSSAVTPGTGSTAVTPVVGGTAVALGVGTGAHSACSNHGICSSNMCQGKACIAKLGDILMVVKAGLEDSGSNPPDAPLVHDACETARDELFSICKECDAASSCSQKLFSMTGIVGGYRPDGVGSMSIAVVMGLAAASALAAALVLHRSRHAVAEPRLLREVEAGEKTDSTAMETDA